MIRFPRHASWGTLGWLGWVVLLTLVVPSTVGLTGGQPPRPWLAAKHRYLISKLTGGVCNQMIMTVWCAKLAQMLNLTYTLPAIRGIGLVNAPKGHFESYWNPSPLLATLRQLNVRVTTDDSYYFLNKSSRLRGKKVGLVMLRSPYRMLNRYPHRSLHVADLMEAAERLIRKRFCVWVRGNPQATEGEETGAENRSGVAFSRTLRQRDFCDDRAQVLANVPLYIITPILWFMQFSKAEMPWFSQLMKSFFLADRLKAIAQHVVQALGGAGKYSALHFRPDKEWCWWAFKFDGCYKLEIECAVKAMRKIPGFSSTKVLFISSVFLCSSKHLRQISAQMGMNIYCSNDLYATLRRQDTTGDLAVRPTFFDKALINLYVSEHAGYFCGRLSSSMSFVVLLRRYLIHHIPRSRNGLYSGHKNVKNFGCFGLPCGYLRDTFQDGDWDVRMPINGSIYKLPSVLVNGRRRNVTRFQHSSLVKPCCPRVVEYLPNFEHERQQEFYQTSLNKTLRSLCFL